MHLEELPIPYNLVATPDRFIAGVAFMSARNRYSCADSLIGAGFGGTVLGAMTRSLFVDGLRWTWIADDPERRKCLLGTLLDERNRLSTLLESADATCPILPRWLMPVPDVADLAGNSMTWLDAPVLPSEDELLDHFLGLAFTSGGLVGQDRLRSHARELLELPGLRGAVMVLAHAGHGNYLGLQSSLADDGVPAHDLRPDHEALFMHVGAVGAATTLVGTAAAVPELWPHEVHLEDFLERTLALAAEVAKAAAPLHGLVGSARPESRKAKAAPAPQSGALLRPSVVVRPEDWLPDVNSTTAVATAAETYFEVAGSFAISPWSNGDPALHTVLAYTGGHSGLQAVMSTYDQPGSAVIAVFAARMLLEEAARLHWRYSLADEAAFKVRAKQFFDEYRARRRKTINTLAGSGVPRPNAERLFSRPKHVRVITPDDDIAKGRPPLPPISAMLRDFGADYPEPGWLELAYSLLSQVTHTTPIGLLHTIRCLDGEWKGNEVSPEMLALAIDTACLSSAVLIGVSTLVLANMDNEAVQFKVRLSGAAARVHDAARLVHGLD